MTAFTFDAKLARNVERIYQTPDIIEQRRRTRALLGAQAGDRVLDVGCGPGFLLRELAQDLGAESRLAGIDISADMIQLARSRCAGHSQIRLEIGDATALQFDDSSFDSVVSTQVYEYVPDLAKALAEAARVLRYGGRLLIVATDWESSVWANSDEVRMQRVLDAWRGHCTESRLPRKLTKLLREANFRITTATTIPIVNLDFDPNTYGHSMITAISRYAAGRGGVSEAEAQAWAADFATIAARGDYFFSVDRHVFVATKPG